MEAEVWDEKKCIKEAKRLYTDHYGTKSHMRGLQQFSPPVLPELADGFEWVYADFWNWRIIKTENKA